MKLSPRLLVHLSCLAALLWVLAQSIQRSGEAVVFRSDAQFLYDNVRHLPGVMRGRISLDAALMGEGEALGSEPLVEPRRASGQDRGGAHGEAATSQRPLDGFRVSVMAQAHGGGIAVRKVVEVDAVGAFEVFGLPEGTATVSVQLRGGAELWRAEGVACGRSVATDPRLDPIRLDASLYWFDLRLFDDAGAPSRAGHLVWRESGSGGAAGQAFTGRAVIETGRAAFAATSPCLDVVPLVPGAATELFEGLYGEEEVHLGPGVCAVFEVETAMPLPPEWRVRLSLSPVTPQPAIDYVDGGLELSDLSSPQVVEIDGRGAELSLARGGTFEIAWWVVSTDPREEVSMRLQGQPSEVEVPPGPGRHRIAVDFPVDDFLERAASGR
ncbi:MAG: hypothetical protein P8R46_01740 [Planctomycetota bacterium]|nr:hypothetical protein [Planctomycetota bacterium]